MSRSFKKVPGMSEGEGSIYRAFAKRQANKRIRQIGAQSDIDADCAWYKRYTCSYNICDWNFRYWTPQELKRECEKYEWAKEHQSRMK